MDYDLMNILISGSVSLLFGIAGGYMLYKGGKKLYRSYFATTKVSARCIEIQRIREQGEMLYRPVYEYELNGQLFQATSLEYTYENDVRVGEVLPVYVEKKHPDVIAETPDNKAAVIITLVVGVFLMSRAIQFLGSIILMMILDLW